MRHFCSIWRQVCAARKPLVLGGFLRDERFDRRIRPQNRWIRPQKPPISNPKWRTDASHVAHRRRHRDAARGRIIFEIPRIVWQPVRALRFGVRVEGEA
jgi:hypothetical protein